VEHRIRVQAVKEPRKPTLAAYDAVVARVVLLLAARWQAITHQSADILARSDVPEDRIRVTPNRIDRERFLALPAPYPERRKYRLEEELVTLVGRLGDVAPPLSTLWKRLDAYSRLPSLKVGNVWS
jgi:hypothetical protein